MVFMIDTKTVTAFKKHTDFLEIIKRPIKHKIKVKTSVINN